MDEEKAKLMAIQIFSNLSEEQQQAVKNGFVRPILQNMGVSFKIQKQVKGFIKNVPYVPYSYTHALGAFEAEINKASDDEKNASNEQKERYTIQKNSLKEQYEKFKSEIDEAIISELAANLIKNPDFDAEIWVMESVLDEKRNEYKVVADRYIDSLREMSASYEAQIKSKENEIRRIKGEVDKYKESADKLKKDIKTVKILEELQEKLKSINMNNPRARTDIMKEIEMQTKTLTTFFDMKRIRDPLMISTALAEGIEKMKDKNEKERSDLLERKKKAVELNANRNTLAEERKILIEKKEKNDGMIAQFVEKRDSGLTLYLGEFSGDSRAFYDVKSEEYFTQNSSDSRSKLAYLKFSVAYQEREMELLSLSTQIHFLENLYGVETLNQDNPVYAYRACAKQDDIEKGIYGKDTGRLLHPFEHIAFGSSSGDYHSPYISVTRSPLIMSLFAHDFKNPTEEPLAQQIAIDISQLYQALKSRRNEIYEVSSSERSDFGELPLIPGQWKQKLPGEVELLSVLNPDVFELERWRQEISAHDSYDRASGSSLPKGIFNISDEFYVEREAHVLNPDGKGESMYSYRANAPRTMEAATGYGRSSLELLFNGVIPYQTDIPEHEQQMSIKNATEGSVQPVKRQIIVEMETLTSDLIQGIRPSEEVLNRKNSIVTLKTSEFLSENVGNLGLSEKAQEFARRFYCEHESVDTILMGGEKGGVSVSGILTEQEQKTVRKMNKSQRHEALLKFEELMRDDIVTSLHSNEAFRTLVQEKTGVDLSKYSHRGVIPNNYSKTAGEVKLEQTKILVGRTETYYRKRRCSSFG